MSEITTLFRTISPEEEQLRAEIKAMQAEARAMRKELRADIDRWRQAMNRQRRNGLQDCEIHVTKQWIDKQAESRMAAVRLQESKIVQAQGDIQKAAGIMSRQAGLF